MQLITKQYLSSQNNTWLISLIPWNFTKMSFTQSKCYKRNIMVITKGPWHWAKLWEKQGVIFMCWQKAHLVSVWGAERCSVTTNASWGLWRECQDIWGWHSDNGRTELEHINWILNATKYHEKIRHLIHFGGAHSARHITAYLAQYNMNRMMLWGPSH